MSKKIRVDKLLVERELVESREQAQRLVMAGLVFSGVQRMVKPAQLLKSDADLEIRGAKHPYVSRGGLKLEKALDTFGLDLKGRRCLDLGASTGGFTDLMLQKGARHVTSVDVGKGQLHWKLREDERVTVMEKTNARYLQPGDFPQAFDFLTGDLSFIGLHLILPAAFALGAEEAEAVFLIKPQFEAGREQVGRGGVVRNPQTHREVLMRVLSHSYEEYSFFPRGLVRSPIKGPAGNIEYLVHYRRDCFAEFSVDEAVESVLDEVRRVSEV